MVDQQVRLCCLRLLQNRLYMKAAEMENLPITFSYAVIYLNTIRQVLHFLLVFENF